MGYQTHYRLAAAPVPTLAEPGNFVAGKMQVSKAEIRTEPFDPLKLREVTS